MDDFITLVYSENHANKVYDLENGEVVKSPPKYYSNRIAKTIKVDDLKHLKAILKWISELENVILILGYIPETDVYNLVTKSVLQNIAGQENVKGVYEYEGQSYAARLKNTFKQSSYFVFDKDTVLGMPKKLVFDNSLNWIKKLKEGFPELANCGYLKTGSNSSRVVYNNKALDSLNYHFYMKAKKASDIERFGKAMLIKSFNVGLGFMKENKTGGKRPWSIFDPTTFSSERELYEGKPLSLNENITIKSTKIEHFEGSIIDTESLQNPSVEEQEALGLMMSENSNGGIRISNTEDLTKDTVIDFENFGVMSLREYLAKHGNTRCRCQSPFRRDSTSFAAYVNFTKFGEPFLCDSGTNINYYLKVSAKDNFKNIIENNKKDDKNYKEYKKENRDFINSSTNNSVYDSHDARTKSDIIQKGHKFIDKLRNLETLEHDKSEQSLFCKSLITETLRLMDEPIKIYRLEEIRMVMGWTKKNLDAVIKSYMNVSSESVEEWLLKNVVLMIEENGGYYNQDLNCYQNKTTLNDCYANLSTNDLTASAVVNASAHKKTAHGLGWIPKNLEFFEYSGKKYVNTYVKTNIVPKAYDITPWMTIMRHIYGEYMFLVLQHMAFTVQHPEKKILWQILTWGEPRTGKSLSIQPLVRILQDSAGNVTNEMLEAGWDDIYYRRKAIVFNEIMQDSKKIFNRLKSKLSDSEYEILNIKCGAVVVQKNYYSMYMFSNFDNALQFDVNQQKLLVIRAPDYALAESFYTHYSNMLDNPRFIAGCYNFLMKLDVSKFNHGKLPVTTRAAIDMCNDALPDYHKRITEWVFNGEKVFKYQCFTFDMLKEELIKNHIRCSDKNAIKVLTQNGFSKKRVQGEKSKRTVWTANEAIILDSKNFFKIADAELKMRVFC